MTELDRSRWVILYPVYINSKKTLAEGRRISTLHACENPTPAEIGDCCTYLKLNHALELDKAYSRDFMQRGRVRVQLKKGNGSPVNPEVPSTLMLKVAELVSKHLGRIKKGEASSSGAGASNTSSGKSGRGGKKKK